MAVVKYLESRGQETRATGRGARFLRLHAQAWKNVEGARLKPDLGVVLAARFT